MTFEDDAVEAMLSAVAISPVPVPPPPGPDSFQPDTAPPAPERELPVFSLALLGGLAVAGVLGDLALRTGLASLAGMLATFVVVALLLRSHAVTGPLGKASLLLAAFLACWLPFRASPWLIAPTVLAIMTLAVAAVMVERVNPWGITMPRIFQLIPRLFSAAFGPVAVIKSVFGGGRRLTDGRSAPLIRGVALAAIPVAVLIALLASADAVFASLFSLPFDPSSAIGHSVVAAVCTGAVAALLTIAHARPASVSATDRPHRRWLGDTESLVLLVGMVAVYGVFVATQIVTAAGGAQHILDTAGLTRAEYARSGFFQMLAAASLTLMLLFIVQTWCSVSDERMGRVLRALSITCSLLTVAVVAVSIIRLDLYADAFGLTRLRLYSTVFAAFIGAVFVLFIIDTIVSRSLRVNVGAGPSRAWFLPAVGLLAWGVLMTLNGFSPDAVVSAWNAEHQTTHGEFDAFYAGGLSADAVPTLVAKLDTFDRDDRENLVNRLCETNGPSGGFGVLGWNRAEVRADNLLQDLCG